MAQQTAVEWLWNEIDNLIPYQDINKAQQFNGLLEQAKAMEKEQIMKAWEDGDYAYFYSKETGKDFENGEQYYNETYTDKPKLAYGVYNDMSNRKPDRPLPGEGEGGRQSN